MNMKNRHNLTIAENHIDVEILGNSLKSMGFEYDTRWERINGELTVSEKPAVRSSSHSIGNTVLEGNYIRINSLKYWGDSDHKNLLKALDMANTMASEHIFEYGDICDYEAEWDNDRSWPASFTFYSHKK